MKILMVNYEFPPIGGGGGQAHQNLLREYAKMKGLEVDVLTSGLGQGLQREEMAENITIYKVGIRKNNLHYWRKSEVMIWLYKARREYDTLIQNNQYDLVHAFFGFPSGWLCYRSRKQLPYIISLRGSDVPGYNERLGLDYFLLAGLFRRIWRGASFLVANSRGLKELAQQFMPDLNIQVIPNGINTNTFYPAENFELTKPLKILTVGRLIRRKRIELLIGAIAELNTSGLDVVLSIAGEGNLMEELQTLAKNLGIAERVYFLGNVSSDKMPEVYRHHHIFVMASMHEGMSNAMLEAMASGLPIITSPCEGVEELIDDNGIIIRPPMKEAFAEAIGKLVQDKNARGKMAAAACQKAETFTWKAAAAQYLPSYNSLLKRNR